MHIFKNFLTVGGIWQWSPQPVRTELPFQEAFRTGHVRTCGLFPSPPTTPAFPALTAALLCCENPVVSLRSPAPAQIRYLGNAQAMFVGIKLLTQSSGLHVRIILGSFKKKNSKSRPHCRRIKSEPLGVGSRLRIFELSPGDWKVPQRSRTEPN